ncbi:hypothetical protein HAX54_037026, partial [Datura stramonium]|nr:hypothetical protein [Datura stramonium]
HHAQPPMNLVGPQPTRSLELYVPSLRRFDRLEDTKARLEWSASATKIANSRANLKPYKVRLFVERTTPRDTRKKPMEDGNEKNLRGSWEKIQILEYNDATTETTCAIPNAQSSSNEALTTPDGLVRQSSFVDKFWTYEPSFMAMCFKLKEGSWSTLMSRWMKERSRPKSSCIELQRGDSDVLH